MQISKFIFYLFFLFVPFTTKAQDASKIMDAVTNSLRKYKSIKSIYTLTYKENGKTSSQNGAIILQGNKYVNKTGGTMTWFDGKTMWAYVKENEEVTITTPSSEELASSNPYTFINSSKKDFTASIISSDGNQFKIKLIPKTSNNDINYLILNVKKKSYQPVDMLVDMKNSKIIIVLNSFETNKSYKNSSFTFSKSKYPDVEVVDLR